jgi:succinoglycan biosynthesis protein ExoO
MQEKENQSVISIVMPVYNCEKTVEKAIESALAQSYTNIEIVVVDDCSTDDSAVLVEKLAAKDKRIKLIKLPKNVGVGGARKKAFENISGEYVTLLDADDWYLPNRLQNLLQAMHDLNADMICDNLYLFDHELGKTVGKTEFSGNKTQVLEPYLLFKLDTAFKRHPLGFTQPLIKTSFLREKNITYNTDYRCGEDFLFLAEIVLSGARTYIIPSADYVYIHRISPSARTVAPNSTAGHGFDDILKSCDHILEKYGESMSELERSSLAMKKRSIEDWVSYQELLHAIRSKDYGKASDLLKKQPLLYLVKFHTVKNRILDLIMIKKFNSNDKNLNQA